MKSSEVLLLSIVMYIIDVSLVKLWIREWPLTPVFSPGELHGQRSLVVSSKWGLIESDTTEQFSLHFNGTLKFFVLYLHYFKNVC